MGEESDVVEEAQALLEMGAYTVDAGTVERLLDRVRELEAQAESWAQQVRDANDACNELESELLRLHSPRAAVARAHAAGYAEAIADVVTWLRRSGDQTGVSDAIEDGAARGACPNHAGARKSAEALSVATGMPVPRTPSLDEMDAATADARELRRHVDRATRGMED